MKEMKKTNELVMTAMMVCLVALATMMIRIPTPGTEGYIHLGDAMIFVAVMILGWRKGAVAASVGSAMADLLSGYASWVPWTFAIKGLMALAFGIIFELSLKSVSEGAYKKAAVIKVIGMLIGGVIMVGGYFVAAGLMYGNWMASFVNIPMNCIQLGAGMFISLALEQALRRTSASKYFHTI